jgi:hypothetical protein
VGKGARGGEHRRARHGRDGGAQWWRRDGSGRRKAPNRAGERNNGKATGRAVADGDRVASPIMGARKALTSGARLLERERDRKRARGSAADGWGRAGSSRGERGRVGDGALGPRGGGGRKARAREEVWAGSGPAEGGSFLFFYFLFLISISFNSFSFEQIIS